MGEVENDEERGDGEQVIDEPDEGGQNDDDVEDLGGVQGAAEEPVDVRLEAVDNAPFAGRHTVWSGNLPVTNC